jgi:putative membrane protein
VARYLLFAKLCGMTTDLISKIFFGLAGLIHVMFFVLEAVLFQRPEGYKYFKLEAKDHQAVKIWALNQGYYNLFFAFGIIAGLAMNQIHLQIFCALSMVGAGFVLWFSAPQLRRGSLVQIIPPLLGLMLLFGTRA